MDLNLLLINDITQKILVFSTPPLIDYLCWFNNDALSSRIYHYMVAYYLKNKPTICNYKPNKKDTMLLINQIIYKVRDDYVCKNKQHVKDNAKQKLRYKNAIEKFIDTNGIIADIIIDRQNIHIDRQKLGYWFGRIFGFLESMPEFTNREYTNKQIAINYFSNKIKSDEREILIIDFENEILKYFSKKEIKNQVDRDLYNKITIFTPHYKNKIWFSQRKILKIYRRKVGSW